MKQVTLTLDTARQMYNSGSPELKKFALDNFTEQELTKKALPKRWEDIEQISGYYISPGSVILPSSFRSDQSHRNILPTKELAEAVLALCQLLYLRDIYNDGWVPDWNSGIATVKYVIYFLEDSVTKGCNYTAQRVLAFKSPELRDEFLNNFRSLIETAKPLL